MNNKTTSPILAFAISIIYILIISCSDDNRAPQYPFKEITSDNIDEALEYAKSDSLNVWLQKKIMGYYTITNQYDILTDYCTKTYDIGARTDTEPLVMVSSAYLAQRYFFKERFDKCEFYLDVATSMIDRYIDGNKDIAVLLYNVSAGLALRKDLDYSKAVDLLKRSLDLLDRQKDSLILCGVLCNIATIYETLNDTTGIRYAKEAYALSRGFRQPGMIVTATITYSSLFAICKDYGSALHYGRQALDEIKSFGYKQFESLAYLNIGNIYAELGITDSAECAYKDGLAALEYTKDRGAATKLYASYANVLKYMRRYDEALQLFHKADKLSEANDNAEMRYRIYQGLSDIYDQSRQTDSAYIYFKKYHDAYYDATNFMKERQVNRLQRQYERERFLNEVKEKEIEIMTKERTNTITFFIILILLTVLACAYAIYRKRNATYKKLITQYKHYKARIDGLREAEKKKQQQASSGRLFLYESIEQLMKDKELFRDKNLSLNLAAEILKVSPEKISGAVKEYSGMTFPNYVNAYRIEYAARKLSEADNGDSIIKIFEDAGFTSKATAYRSFQKEIGCSPAIYRNEMSKGGR